MGIDDYEPNLTRKEEGKPTLPTIFSSVNTREEKENKRKEKKYAQPPGEAKRNRLSSTSHYKLTPRRMGCRAGRERNIFVVGSIMSTSTKTSFAPTRLK